MLSFRIAIRKTQSSKEILYTLLMMILLLFACYNYTNIFPAVLCICGAVFMLSIICSAFQWFYVELSDQYIAVKNPVYRFLNKTYPLYKIQKVEIGYAGGYTRPYIRMMTDGRWSGKRVIELVGIAHYRSVVAAIRDKNIEVETPRLDKYLAQRERKINV